MASYLAYPEYSLDGFPALWKQKRLRFALKMNPSKNEINLEDSDLVSFVPMDAIGEYGGIRLNEEKELSEIGSGYTYFCDDDVVVAKITPCFENGKGALAKGLKNKTAFGTTELYVMRAVREQFEPQFLFYLTISDLFRKIGESEMYGAGGQKRVPENFIKDFRAALPSMEEQKTISRFLDFKTAQIDTLIAKKKVLLDKLAEKRTALISHAVTKGLDPSVAMKDSGVAWLGEVPTHWTIMRARYASTFVTSGSRGWAEYYSDSGSIFLRITNVSRDSVDLLLHDIQRVLPPESSEGERTATQSGDVLVSITADLGSVAVIPDGFENAYVSQHLALVRPNGDRIFGRWMAYQFFSASGQAQLTGSGYGGTKIQLGLGDVKDVWLALPPTDEQEEICTWIGAEVDKLKRQSDAIHDVILRLREYRSALITNAVTGKIDVRGFEIPPTVKEVA
ncbi:type I restriction-modification system, specificity subunit S [Aquitalea magnusonii]|uniref:Type I restriction-modification system, specificity subunit S n=1 Tax=Aquitalea magnusonii TaxID=332411 RepID=A0A3G9GI02_9NEIS|nr:restriction endonuclease subunit S [Aquitalea magnusonii]BBF86994.1 type I restriction-modification system, specificity subunit S [Aquitalea magnusonii]